MKMLCKFNVNECELVFTSCCEYSCQCKRDVCLINNYYLKVSALELKPAMKLAHVCVLIVLIFCICWVHQPYNRNIACTIRFIYSIQIVVIFDFILWIVCYNITKFIHKILWYQAFTCIQTVAWRMCETVTTHFNLIQLTFVSIYNKAINVVCSRYSAICRILTLFSMERNNQRSRRTLPTTKPFQCEVAH